MEQHPATTLMRDLLDVLGCGGWFLLLPGSGRTADGFLFLAFVLCVELYPANYGMDSYCIRVM